MELLTLIFKIIQLGIFSQQLGKKIFALIALGMGPCFGPRLRGKGTLWALFRPQIERKRNTVGLVSAPDWEEKEHWGPCFGPRLRGKGTLGALFRPQIERKRNTVIVHTLWNQLSELSLDLINTLQVCYRHIEDMHEEVWCWKNIFDKFKRFLT